MWYVATISPLQQTRLGSTCFEKVFMKRDNGQWTNNIPFGLGSNNGGAQLTLPQSPVMMQIVCNEAEWPHEQVPNIKYTLEYKEKQLHVKLQNLSNKF